MATLDLTMATNVLVGKPATRLPKRRLKQISALLREIPEVREAHVPEIFALGIMQTPRGVLFVVIEPDTAIDAVTMRIDDALGAILKKREQLDVWPVSTEHRLIGTVRETECLVGWRD
ncbi:MAG: enhanced serine sensitivity protein SseB C-terminal domain-containing protein [Gammaproteobacteria bacterium]|nr:enhanced serine sensitivity protein SseB C-terminal domain-containing protein [Gammaproteobacteria bacterium]